ncbi:unnamed protein product, partial [Owenia fusiformis]
MSIAILMKGAHVKKQSRVPSINAAFPHNHHTVIHDTVCHNIIVSHNNGESQSQFVTITTCVATVMESSWFKTSDVATLDDCHDDTDEEEHFTLLHAIVVECVMSEECKRELKPGIQ